MDREQDLSPAEEQEETHLLHALRQRKGCEVAPTESSATIPSQNTGNYYFINKLEEYGMLGGI
jgi:hypothetical protein